MVRWRVEADRILNTDEADYVRAMRYGPVAAYLGTLDALGTGISHLCAARYRATGWARSFKADREKWRRRWPEALPPSSRTITSRCSWPTDGPTIDAQKSLSPDERVSLRGGSIAGLEPVAQHERTERARRRQRPWGCDRDFSVSPAGWRRAWRARDVLAVVDADALAGRDSTLPDAGAEARRRVTTGVTMLTLPDRAHPLPASWVAWRA